MVPTTRLTVSGLRARAVDVPVRPPLETASATLGSAPLVLVDLLTEEGVTGRSYAFCYTPLALGNSRDTKSRGFAEELGRSRIFARSLSPAVSFDLV